MHIEKDYTNDNFQTIKSISCVGSEIFTYKSVQFFGGKIWYFYIPNILGTSDAVFIWPLISQSEFVLVIVKRN